MNTSIFRYLNSFAFRDDRLDIFMQFSATTLGTILIIAAIAFLLWHTHKREDGPWRAFQKKIAEIIFVLLTIFLAWAVSSLLKDMIANPRPFEALSNVNLLMMPDSDYSFPSGHATFFSALAVAMYFYHRQASLIFFAGALLIGISRIAVGVHYPADILGGYVLGALVTLATYRFLRPWFRRLKF
jgi:undecaprenyl-diphosphatase